MAPPLNLEASQRTNRPLVAKWTHPAAPARADAIAVTVLITGPVLDGRVVDPPVATGAAGVEEGEESSRQLETDDPPTVMSALDPPILYWPASKAARMNCVPAAILVFHAEY